MKKTLTLAISAIACTALLSGCKEEVAAPAAPAGIDPQVFTDSLFAVMKSDRTNYTKLIVQRLGPNKGGFIKPNEHWEDMDDGAPLPAQMFRFGAEGVADMTDEFTYSLQSIWPVNSQNAPKTAMEKEGLQFVADNPGKNFYGKEELGGTTYYTAVYADVAVSPACTTCHNEHKDSPRTDFKIGDVMGGVVIRVPLVAAK
ncbi:MAG: Tll0287-like domain-containing protein [Oceanobacter sp.]